jgi:hypothetical protein
VLLIGPQVSNSQKSLEWLLKEFSENSRLPKAPEAVSLQSLVQLKSREFSKTDYPGPRELTTLVPSCKLIPLAPHVI